VYLPLASGSPRNYWKPPWSISEAGDIQRIKVDYEAHRKRARKSDRPSRQGLDPQGKAFIQKAREFGCDEDEAAFEKRLRKIAKAKPSDQPKPKGRKVS
jgi:hypothetical protein